MYLPPNCPTLDKVSEPQIRLGIQGFGGTGKTYAASTFPNPVYLNPDRGLGAQFGRADIVEVPVWKKEFCKTINPNFGNSSSVTIKDIIELWLKKDGTKLEEDQTLVVDGNTGLQNAYHKWYEQNPVVTKGGKIDDFAEWRLKINFFGDICDTLKTLRCNVIYVCHETEKKDKGGDYTGKLRPLLRGQFGDEIMTHFTDWVRAHSTSKDKALASANDNTLKLWNMSSSEYREMVNSFSGNAIYFWQLESDEFFDGKVSSLSGFPKYIPATYASFRRYMKNKISIAPLAA